jgi:pSer/pThr/pTyr-binding forkhead associated (FHA) protein
MSRPSSAGSMPGRPVLTLIFQGRKVAISADQFIIGRGAKSSDFMIKDANISRKHAAIIFHNNTYYIKDLGSTNGIEFNGKTVDSKRIDEGDVFTICGHDLHFTYNA